MFEIKIVILCALFVVFYTYIGYGILLYVMVKIKETFVKPKTLTLPNDLPEVTLFIAAYNEQDIIEQKMINCRELDYPKDKLSVFWVTDGSNDRSVEMLSAYDDVTLLHSDQRGGKMAAFNRGMDYVKTPIVVYCDANTMLNSGAIKEIVRLFTDPKVGCVSGEKRVALEGDNAAATEGVYWKYESTLKNLDYRLYSTMGAAGELFAVRTHLYEKLSPSILLDDFILSMRIAQKGYIIAYSKEAYAVEGSSLNMKEEGKRKVRISAGGLQSVALLGSLLNPFKYGILSFQYISHRVLRWTLAPLCLVLLLFLNTFVALFDTSIFYKLLLIMQVLFYAMGFGGWMLSLRGSKNKLLFVPYYFIFMNLNVFYAIGYLRRRKGSMGIWDKAKRA